MGKASSSKKVARAAKAGGRASIGQQRNLLFPTVVSLVIILGVSLIWFARSDRQQAAADGVPQLGDHIHMAYGIYICDKYLDPIPTFESQKGIHTHGDGVIHIHPFSADATGKLATLGLFLDGAKVKLSDTSITAGGKIYKNGQKCGTKDARVQVLRWDKVTDTVPTRLTGSFRKVRLESNGAGLAIVFAPLGANVPQPPSFANLAQLGAADSGQTTPSTTVTKQKASSTTTGEPSGSSSSTATTGGSTSTSGP